MLILSLFLLVPDGGALAFLGFIELGVHHAKVSHKIRMDEHPRDFAANLAQFRKGRIITVFGCGGDRDRGKRPLMGRAAAEESDLVIITSDNPRTEEPLAIISAIEGGIDAGVMKKVSPDALRAAPSGKIYTVVADRRQAIGLAIDLANADDIVLIAGKGHEDYQIIGTETVPFDDRTAGREALDRKRGSVR